MPMPARRFLLPTRSHDPYRTRQVLPSLEIAPEPAQSGFAEEEMDTASEVVFPIGGLPRTMKYCGVCHCETPHQIGTGGGLPAVVCLPCWRRDTTWELDRD